jgi:integrase
VCRNHIIPEIVNKKLQDLKPIDIVQFQNKLMKNKTASVAHNTMRILRKILNKAIEWEYISSNPIKGKLPPAPKTEHPVLTLDELFNMIRNLHGRDKYVVALAGFAAFRISEIFGLKWSDIDFKRNTITIRRQFINGKIITRSKQEMLRPNTAGRQSRYGTCLRKCSSNGVFRAGPPSGYSSGV